MRYVIAVNFVRNMPWLPCWWAVVLARGLAQRGRRVAVVADGVECPEVFGGLELHIARPHRVHLGAPPGRFRRLVRQVAAEPSSVILSLTPLVAGDLWMPVEAAPWTLARRLVRDLKPVSLMLELLHHPWLPAEALSALAARIGAPPPLAFGTAGLPRVSTLADEQVLAAHAAAPKVRASLGLAPDRLNAVLPAVETSPHALERLFRAMAPGAPDWALLVPTARPHTAATAAARAGLRGVTPMGLTASLPALAAACDLALACPTAGLGDAGGRWIADALRLGTPVVTDASAHGAELVERHGGRVVRTPADWPRALADARDPAWRESVRKSLGAASDALAPDVLLDELESRAAALAIVGPRARPAARPHPRSSPGAADG